MKSINVILALALQLASLSSFALEGGAKGAEAEITCKKTQLNQRVFRMQCDQKVFNPEGVEQAVLEQVEKTCGEENYESSSELQVIVNWRGFTTAYGAFSCLEFQDSCTEMCGRPCHEPPVFCGQW